MHGQETIQKYLSNFYMTDEISSVYRGMMIALPPKKWAVFQAMSQAHLGKWLRRLAGGIDFGSYQKHTRGPKKPRLSRPNAQFHHVSTKKLLDQKQSKKKRKQLVANKAGP